jgi:hypothetical protein
MAYTREQRAQKEAENKAKLEAEMRAKIEAEMEAKLRAEYEEKFKNTITEINDTESVEVPKRTKATRIPLDTMVTVVCNTIGGATYISKKASGYIVEWEDLGSEEYMELGELVAMRNTDRRFFEDNWIVLEDTDEYDAMQLYEFLKVAKYYTNVFTSRNIDELFSYSKDKIIRTISTLSRGMKETIAVRAKQKLDDDTLDKNIVDTLESALGIQFTL